MPKKTSNTKKTIKTPRIVNTDSNYLEKLENEIQSNQSKVSMVLGALIILVLGILIFNYFSKDNGKLGPAQQTEAGEDVSPNDLPGKYTVKEDDTLFTIAEKYYQDGYKYTKIAEVNNLTNVDQIETGQILEIPKLEQLQTEETQASPTATPEEQPKEEQPDLGTGGGNMTIWGAKIEEDKYTIVEGDWLSTIAGRAYGDVFTYDRLAKANNITDPNTIEPGTVLTIPR